MSSGGSNKRFAIYDKLHRIAIVGILGVSLVAGGLLMYNFYLFKKEGVPMLIEKYRAKAEEEIELKQREAEYLEQRRKSERDLFK